MLPELDIEGQEKLGQASVLVIGLGGLGSPAAIYLAAAGIGEVTLVDEDVVDLSNLQRQIVHREASIGEPKVASAENTIKQISSATNITTIATRLRGDQLLKTVSHADVVVDATDNFESRYEIIDANSAGFRCRHSYGRPCGGVRPSRKRFALLSVSLRARRKRKLKLRR